MAHLDISPDADRSPPGGAGATVGLLRTKSCTGESVHPRGAETSRRTSSDVRRRQTTVFAPTDDAFAALGLDAGTVGSLDRDALTQVLLYHVTNGRRDSNDVLASTQLRTVQGAFLQQSSGTLTDALGRPANIVVVDVPASNGIIHAIDAVVLPFAP
jgi:uncharacterized surface protein with fasciclin (FAS1) repeats